MKKFLLFIFIFTQFLCFASENSQNNKLRILLGCPVHQKPAILKEFLESLNHLKQQNYSLDYFFIDDNSTEESSQQLKEFSEKQKSNCLILSKNNDSIFHCDESGHNWNEELIWRVAEFKDLMIQKANTEDYDYLFLVDSDIALHPKTIEQLLIAKKDIIANVFWTKWTSNADPLPYAWLSDDYSMFQKEPSEHLTKEIINKKTKDFLDMLRDPGVHEVGGLGGCTLISKTALKKGVSFEKISNLTIFKEDSHFCFRASVLGLSLFVDTHYPAFHIYRESDLARLEDFKKNCDMKTPRITLSMVIHNEANRYLKEVLQKAKEFITDAVIIDDASTDNSAEVCLEVLKGIPLHLIINTKSKFANEIELRKQQWEETIKTNPEWILGLDADQLFEDKFKDNIKNMIIAKDIDVYLFRQYDFWNETQYRDDRYWQGHNNYYAFLMKYNQKIDYKWKEQAQHCGHFPQTIWHLKKKNSDLRLKHFGWAKPEDRIAKYQRYKLLDPECKFGWKEQYDSILDENPKLIKWQE